MDWTGPNPALFLFILMIIFVLKLGILWNKSSQNLPPGPRPLPLIGNLHIMDLKRPYRTMLKLSKQYGPVFSIQMGPQKTVVLTGYETVKEALVNQADAFADRPIVPMPHEHSQGFGLVLSNGENWKVMRRFALSTLRDYGMGKRTIEDRIVEECNVLIKKFESYEGNPFETTTIMNAAVANIIVAILLDKRFDYEDPTYIRLLKLVNENVRLVGSSSVMLCKMFPALGFLLGAYKTVLQNRDELFAFINATFLKHLRDLDENDQRSFIDSFLIQQQEFILFVTQEKKKKKTNAYFHNENLTRVVADLFGAGMETTSTTMRWGLLLMMKYPEIQIKVQEEIAKVVGSSQPRIEHRTKMPYTDAVVHEIQRFANIIPTNLAHATATDVTLNGYFIAKGTHVIPLLSSVLHDESQWEKPHKFYPEHFLNSEGKFVKRDAFMPFSAGRRACLGETLAKMELFLFFASLLQRFTFQPPPGTSQEDLDLTPAVGLTTPPMPHQLCALPRF
ncbi:cytochrome P450 2K6-like isoform X3 [Zootoca vivipara]|uniref:cytochrome P450 2K6-like isoform X3 n=1 Tax=Zootoca vivipara TaxID=8524 RepID=UPI00293BBD35|nr:cytochrome P450 2K6-like isoform X3 [Zootoca vivipara]